MVNNDAAVSTNNKTVLIVEDDPNVQAIYKELLIKEGYGVILTATADQAMDALKNKKVNLVLLDIMLAGGKNGFDFLETSKKQGLLKNVAVVVLSNLDKDNNVSSDDVINEWLVKVNVSSGEVIEKINKILS